MAPSLPGILTWHGDPPITGVNASFSAGTYISRRIHMHTSQALSLSWFHSASDFGSVTSLDVYGSLVSRDSALFEVDSANDNPLDPTQPWVLLPSLTYSALPTGAEGHGPIDTYQDLNLSVILVRMVVGADIDNLTLLFKSTLYAA